MIFKWRDLEESANNARSAALHARSSRTEMEKRSRVCFRQRHGGGRCTTAPFQPSLRLRFTLPPAEPLTEAVPSRTQPALRPTFTCRSQFAAPSANSRRTILCQNRRKKPAHAAKLPALSSDAMRVANRPKRTSLARLVRERMKEKIECYQNIKNLLPIRRSW